MPVVPPSPQAVAAVRHWWQRVTGGTAPDLWTLWWRFMMEAWQEAGAPPPTSWFRTANENRRVRGEPASQHLLGLAVDFPAGTPAEPFTRRGFQAQVLPTHTHVQTFPASIGVVTLVDQATGIPLSREL